MAQPWATTWHHIVGLRFKSLLESAGVKLDTFGKGKGFSKAGILAYPCLFLNPYMLKLILKFELNLGLGGKGLSLSPISWSLYHTFHMTTMQESQWIHRRARDYRSTLGHMGPQDHNLCQESTYPP
jgi:hypothetical protein